MVSSDFSVSENGKKVTHTGKNAWETGLTKKYYHVFIMFILEKLYSVASEGPHCSIKHFITAL